MPVEVRRRVDVGVAVQHPVARRRPRRPGPGSSGRSAAAPGSSASSGIRRGCSARARGRPGAVARPRGESAPSPGRAAPSASSGPLMVGEDGWREEGPRHQHRYSRRDPSSEGPVEKRLSGRHARHDSPPCRFARLKWPTTPRGPLGGTPPPGGGSGTAAETYALYEFLSSDRGLPRANERRIAIRKSYIEFCRKPGRDSERPSGRSSPPAGVFSLRRPRPDGDPMP